MTVQPSRQVPWGQRMLVMLLTLLFYYYPSMLTSTLSLFTCYRLDQNTDAVKYWGNARVGLSVACYHSNYLGSRV